jgi:hypothetical protein
MESAGEEREELSRVRAEGAATIFKVTVSAATWQLLCNGAEKGGAVRFEGRGEIRL